jgi:tRNA U34 5-methylaminomethyl-2-thiouridine-forming methyltransferase MnmC
MKDQVKNPYYTPLTPEKGVISLIREWSDSEIEGDGNARRLAAQKIKKYLVETADGSYTLQSDFCDNASETMHTTHGALLEARVKFVNPLKIEGKKDVAILDICSGLGINAAVALETFLKLGKNLESQQIEIDMVDVSWETLAASLIIPSPIDSHVFIKKAVENYLINQKCILFQVEKEKIPKNVTIRVHCQDAREMVKKIPPNKKYDAVFLDPFSPQKSPELYSQNFLLKIKDLLKKDGVILTYTSAAPVRYALIDAGLEVGEGPSLGRGGGTIASPELKKISKPLNEDDERMIALSDAGIPFKDPELSSTPKNIKKQRQGERINARGNYKMASTVKTPIYLARDLNDERIKRRVLKHLRKMGIKDLDSDKSRYLVCPQFSECICNCKQERPSTSRARIKEMEKRLENITNNDYG